MLTLATHVIWTTYMTWPPGHPNGHWSPLFDLYGRITSAGGQLQPGDAVTSSVASQLAKEPPKILTDAEIAVVACKIGELVRHPGDTASSKPSVFAAAIEPTHVHLLLGPVAENLGKCVGRIKGTSSSAVLQMFADGRERVGTGGYWKVFCLRGNRWRP